MEYTVTHHKRAKRAKIRIDDEGAVKITVPSWFRKRDIAALVARYDPWICQTKAAHSKRQTVALEPYRQHPDHIPLLGVWHPVTLDPAQARHAVWRDGRLILKSPASLERFYKTEAKKALEAAVSHFGALLDVTPFMITLRDQKSRWGSCSSKGTLSFNYRLVKGPPGVLEYVALHETAHLRHLHHGKTFWETLAALMPDFSQHEQWLRANALFLRHDPL